MPDPVTHPALVPTADTPGLPRVLLIGDSISMGYTLPVRALLQHKANVHRPPVNCAQTAIGAASLGEWLGDGPWAVVHFNFGLHDLKRVDAAHQLAVPPESGTLVASLDEYESNLRKIVARLKQTGAALIWASTTPVPGKANGRFEGEETAYNAVAARVMEENGVAVDDLWAVARARQSEIQRPHDVHFTPEGCDVLAQAVARSIEAVLPQTAA